MFRARTLGVLGLALLGIAGPAANADTMLYQNNFEAGWLDFRWENHSLLTQDAPIFTTFNGFQSNTAIDFRHNQAIATMLPGEEIEYVLKFDFYAFDSWDGYSTGGADLFQVWINGVNFFNESFSNTSARPQSFREPNLPRANYGGRTSALDAIYRDITIRFLAPNDDKVRIHFQDGGLGGINDESWAIDNFRLAYNVVPAPGALTLAGLGGILMLRRKR